MTIEVYNPLLLLLLLLRVSTANVGNGEKSTILASG